MSTLDLGPWALRGLRRRGPGPSRERVRLALAELARESVNLDVKVLSGRSPWLRLPTARPRPGPTRSTGPGPCACLAHREPPR